MFPKSYIFKKLNIKMILNKDTMDFIVLPIIGFDTHLRIIADDNKVDVLRVVFNTSDLVGSFVIPQRKLVS